MDSDNFEGCPRCGGMDVRLSHSRGILDAIMASLRRVPFRCRWCARRFYRRAIEEAENPATAGGFGAFVWPSTLAGGATAVGLEIHGAMNTTALLGTALYGLPPEAIGTHLVAFPLRFVTPVTGVSPYSQSSPL